MSKEEGNLPGILFWEGGGGEGLTTMTACCLLNRVGRLMPLIHFNRISVLVSCSLFCGVAGWRLTVFFVRETLLTRDAFFMLFHVCSCVYASLCATRNRDVNYDV